MYWWIWIGIVILAGGLGFYAGYKSKGMIDELLTRISARNHWGMY